MTHLTSELFELRAIEGAGRGLIAIKSIEGDGPLLICSDPAVHVIFREYRKEVCAQCFYYDRGRTLPVRENDIGKVFCTEACQIEWHRQVGSLGLKAWRCLEDYIKSNSKHIQEMTVDMLSGSRPTQHDIAVGWRIADRAILNSTNSRTHVKSSAKADKHKDLMTTGPVYPDSLALELSAILLHHFRPETWDSDVAALVADPTPYKSLPDFEIAYNALIQLSQILPIELLPSCISSVSLAAASAGSHNAFGIRAGGEDNEECMGWAVYPNASYFNHSCAPNVNKKRLGREWHFRAARDIAFGDQLCISYLGGDEKDMTVLERQARLECIWGFHCRCIRCQNETFEQNGDLP